MPLNQILGAEQWLLFGRGKAWSKFGCLFYKEVRFDEITELKLGLDKYKLYTNKTMINICYQRFDYTLVFIRMLEELSKRRFNLPEAKITDLNWEEICQRRKNYLIQKILREQKDYYDQHPDELAYLQNLVNQPPPK